MAGGLRTATFLLVGYSTPFLDVSLRNRLFGKEFGDF